MSLSPGMMYSMVHQTQSEEDCVSDLVAFYGYDLEEAIEIVKEYYGNTSQDFSESFAEIEDGDSDEIDDFEDVDFDELF